MIDWNQSDVTPPPMLSHSSSEDLNDKEQIIFDKITCHSQSVQRTIKDVSATCFKVFGHKSRHDMILQSKKSRLDLPKLKVKQVFSMIKYLLNLIVNVNVM